LIAAGAATPRHLNANVPEFVPQSRSPSPTMEPFGGTRGMVGAESPTTWLQAGQSQRAAAATVRYAHAAYHAVPALNRKPTYHDAEPERTVFDHVVRIADAPHLPPQSPPPSQSQPSPPPSRDLSSRASSCETLYSSSTSRGPASTTHADLGCHEEPLWGADPDPLDETERGILSMARYLNEHLLGKSRTQRVLTATGHVHTVGFEIWR